MSQSVLSISLSRFVTAAEGLERWGSHGGRALWDISTMLTSATFEENEKGTNSTSSSKAFEEMKVSLPVSSPGLISHSW